MPTLMLLRHAKAVQHGRGDDFDRDLQDKGKTDARRLGDHLAARGLLPDLALVSSSARTRETFEIVESALGRMLPARYDETLYNATAGELRDALRDIDGAVRSLMVVGHNPGIADAAAMLARDGDLAELSRMRSRFPPCGLAILELEGADWREAAKRGGRLDLFLLPEDLAV